MVSPHNFKKADPDQQVLFTEVSGHPGYFISSDGKVWSRRPLNGIGGLVNEPREMKQAKQDNGYRSVVLDRKTYHVAPLMLKHFSGPSNGLQCRHLDGNKDNNAISNLKWGTAVEQGEDRAKHGTAIIGEKNHNTHLTAADVLAIRALRKQFKPIGVVAKMFHVAPCTISAIANRRVWKHV